MLARTFNPMVYIFTKRDKRKSNAFEKHFVGYDVGICFFQSAEPEILIQKFLAVNKYPEIQYLIAEVYPSITKRTVVFKCIWRHKNQEE